MFFKVVDYTLVLKAGNNEHCGWCDTPTI